MPGIEYVSLSFFPGGGVAGLREMCGHDEQLIGDTDTSTAVQLLDCLLVDTPATALKPGQAKQLTAADRDRLLATVYVQTYGPQVSGTLHCRACQHPFDMSFVLPDLVDNVQPTQSSSDHGVAQKYPDGTYALADGLRFRLPTAEDEWAVWDLSIEEAERVLLERCVSQAISGQAASVTDTATIETAMQTLAPIIDVDLQADCPECHGQYPFHFSIQTYLLAAVRAEHARLIQETHHIALAYGWSLNEIMGLTRSQRRAYTGLIEQTTPGYQSV